MNKVLFLMSGSIAAYKVCQTLSDLKKKDIDIQVVVSPNLLEFIGKATIEGLTSQTVITSLYQDGKMMDHIHAMREADLICLAPATAQTLNHFAHGTGDLLSTFFLAHQFDKPFLVFPAMNQAMAQHPVTQKSVSILKEMGLEFFWNEGVLACGEEGIGRLLESSQITQIILDRLKK